MRTLFSEPSNSYTIVLSHAELEKLIRDGNILYQPLHTFTAHVNKPEKIATGDGHYLQYHGPKPGSMPVQFVCIYLKNEEG